ncbi:MAG: cystathionine gamma-synthase [Planctomycetota bacterium]
MKEKAVDYAFDTLAIHAGQPNDERIGAVSFPIYQTSTFWQVEPGVSRGFQYGRTENPTRRALQECIAALEGGRFGIAFASGMSAVNTCLNLLKPGDHIVTCRELYGGSYRIFTKLYQRFGVKFSFVDATKLEEIEKAVRFDTRLLWLETPSNPLLRVVDLAAAARIVKGRGIKVVVDNTFASPYLQRPLDLGVDVVLHSTTKYLNGHADVIGGALVVNDEQLNEDLCFYQNTVGAVPAPQDCFLTLRGIKTLGVRMERHCANARRIVQFLKEHPKVERVYYPGLPDHPGNEIAKRQMRDFGAMVSFELKAGVGEAKKFAVRTKLFTLAESLGAVKSLLCHPPTMTHASVEPEVRRQQGIPDGLIRLSVGIEDVRDLVHDLEQALEKVEIGSPGRRK